MNIDDVRKSAFAMPLTSPAYPRGPYRFYDREYIIISYRTDIDALRAVVPEPLEVVDAIVKYEFIRMPDSTGFGDYTETGQVIPVRYKGADASYTHSMYLDDEAPIAGGREIWGFPKKLATPKISHESDVITCTLHYGSALVALATIGYKHRILDPKPIEQSIMSTLNFLIKIIPHVDGTARVCELVRFPIQDVSVKGAWASPASLDLYGHAIADVARLPVREIISAVHFKADLTLGLGTVEFDYLAGERA